MTHRSLVSIVTSAMTKVEQSYMLLIAAAFQVYTVLSISQFEAQIKSINISETLNSKIIEGPNPQLCTFDLR